MTISKNMLAHLRAKTCKQTRTGKNLRELLDERKALRAALYAARQTASALLYSYHFDFAAIDSALGRGEDE